MARVIPNVFTLAAGRNFARSVVDAVLSRRLIDLPFAENPALLADLTIYVPTQRIRPMLETAFAEALSPRPAILPRIRPLAEPGDPLDRLIAGEDAASLPAGSLPAIATVARRFLLLPLVERWRGLLRHAATGATAPAGSAVSVRESLALADALGRLIDEMQIAGVPLAGLTSTAPPGYDPAKFDAYWAQSREFLRIAAEYWPKELQRMGSADEMELRLAAIDAEAARLHETDPKTPLLVIGSTGSVLATARLMRAVARLDHGAVVLPGLDLTLDARGWADIAAENASLATRFAHPQAALKRTLAEIGLSREAVQSLDAGEAHPRNRALSEALRPAESVDLWRETRAKIDLDAAFAGLDVIVAGDEREEALAVAILMRETLEDPDATVAFVTADRGLARRVGMELRRWGLAVEDTAGNRLSERPVGIFLRLFLRAARQRDGGSILAFLRHPFTRLGFDQATISALTDALELLVFRGRHFAPDLSLPDRVRHALAHKDDYEHPAVARIPATRREQLHTLVALLEREFVPFSASAPEQSIADFAVMLITILTRLSADASGRSCLDEEPEAADLIEVLTELGAHGQTCRLAPAAVDGAIELFLSEKTLLQGTKTHPCAAILGPLEARLVAADRVIIGGLNEGSFPPVAEEDAFLNRAMRLDLGLQPPERRIGQSAHDFLMLAGSPRVVLTRSARAGEAPSLASRFLRRLEAFAGEVHWKQIVARGDANLRLARQLDAPGGYAPIKAPEPVPSAPRLPKKLSITEIETLRKDPYAIYARHFLGLRPLDPIDPVLDGRERGTLLHACLEEYAKGEPPADPEAAEHHLREIGARHFEPLRHESERFHFWWQRFLAIIPGFVAFDRTRRDKGMRILTEVRGRLVLDLPDGGSITLSGKADRIETGPDARLAIFDYKSGPPPSKTAVASGKAPQLPITASLALRGGFSALSEPNGVSELAYVGIGGVKPVEPQAIEGKDISVESVISTNWAQLEAELAGFARGELAYRATGKSGQGDQPGDYDHLARVAEWRATGNAAEPGDETSEASE
ncbi:MAG: double-strand break repair protein AddB [Rhizobiales bacterium PAR1]|nr:MAG: double-strand break repair protein AddB [Rhizobiales bacterium PAR1]